MRNYRLTGLFACAAGLAACCLAMILHKGGQPPEVRGVYARPLEVAPHEEDPMKYIREDFTVEKEFQTHLPLIVLELEEEPPITTMFSIEEQRFVPKEGLEPYVDGYFYLYDSPEQLNKLSNLPSQESRIRIKRRGNTSMMYEKGQYLMKTVTESGQYRDVDLLGMGAEHEWVLNGSMTDKSMMRNYLAYGIASEFMPFSPESVYCEVLIKQGEVYSYQGVLLLTESIRQGENRVDIAGQSDGGAFTSYLARRDRYDENDIMLNTYAEREGMEKESIGLMYPGKKDASEDVIAYVESDISRIEQILYSTDPKVFSTYPEVINVNSFVDYFLLNEFFANYDSGNNSTYFYKDLGGKLTMGPVWDFDGAMDNYKLEPLEVETLAMQTKPWFAQLCKDPDFLDKLEKRYIELRRGPLNEKHVIAKIDEITRHLGGAQGREWSRWAHIYTQENIYSLDPVLNDTHTSLIRDMKQYGQEINRIKTIIRKHGNVVYAQLEALKKKGEKEGESGIVKRPGIWLFLTCCVFFLPLYYLGRES